jgi:hypothetical protein
VAPDKRSGAPPPRGTPPDAQPSSRTVTAPMVADPADCACNCQQLIRALANIKVELSRLNERLNQAESERAWSP